MTITTGSSFGHNGGPLSMCISDVRCPVLARLMFLSLVVFLAGEEISWL